MGGRARTNCITLVTVRVTPDGSRALSLCDSDRKDKKTGWGERSGFLSPSWDNSSVGLVHLTLDLQIVRHRECTKNAAGRHIGQLAVHPITDKTFQR